VAPKPLRAKASDPPALHERAMADLRFIRETMEQASFTTLSGWGLVAIGATAIVAGLLAGRDVTVPWWFLVWLVEATLAAGIGTATTLRKARAGDEALLPGPVRKFVLGLARPSSPRCSSRRCSGAPGSPPSSPACGSCSTAPA